MKTTKQAIALPTLWASNVEAAQQLKEQFNIIGFGAISGEIPAGDHYILAEPDVHELDVRAVAWKIQAAGKKCRIFWTKGSFINQLAGCSFAAKQLTTQMWEDSLSYEKWAAINNQEKLTPTEAAEFAKAAIELLLNPQRRIELAELRKRCDQNSWEWGNIVKDLENEFTEELRRRGQLPENEGINSAVLAELNKDQDPSDRRAAWTEIAKKHSTSVREIEVLASMLEDEIHQASERPNHQAEIKNLLALTDKELNLASYLPSELEKPLNEYSQWLNVRPEVVLLSLLTATSSLHRVGTQLTLHRTMGFSVPPTIFAAVVADSGQKKSPITRQIVTKPLRILKNEAKEIYKRNLELYQIEMDEWEDRKAATPKEEKFKVAKPEAPALADLFYFSDTTGEGIKAQANAAPHKALFALVDELEGYFNSANQYRGGRGSDKQDLLSYYDGAGQTGLRANGIKVDVDEIYLSIFGTIQPDVIRSTMKDSTDPDGSWARFLFVQQPSAASIMRDDDGSGIDITNLLAGIYRKLHNQPVRQYELSKEAFKIYQPYYNKLEQMRVSCSNSGMRAAYSKAEGCAGRLALNLHVLHELAAGKTPSNEIPAERMSSAIALMNFFLGQTKLLYSTFDEGIAPHIVKMIELSKRRGGWIKARDVQQAFPTKSRPSSEVVRSWMNEAKLLDVGQTRGTGIKIEFNSQANFVDFVDDCRRFVDSQSTGETLDMQRVDSFVDFVDSFVDTPPAKKLDELIPPLNCPPEQSVDFVEEGTSTNLQNVQNVELANVLAVDSQSTKSSTKQEESTKSESISLDANKSDIKVGDRVTSRIMNEDFPSGLVGTIAEIFSPTACRVAWVKDCGKVVPNREFLADLIAVCTINQPQTAR